MRFALSRTGHPAPTASRGRASSATPRGPAPSDTSRRRGFGREMDVDLTNADFVHLAEAYGADGVRLERLDERRPALATVPTADRMTIIEAPGDPAHRAAVPRPRL